MCKILMVINTKPENNEKIQQIITANIDELKTQRNGYSIFRENKTKFYLSEDYDNFAENAKYNGENVFCIHSRISTGGDSDKKGLHLQSIGNWFWAHNGVVTRFMSAKDYSDSYYFFKELLSKQPIDKVNFPVSENNINETVDECGFSGKGFLYNPKSLVLQWFCNSKTYLYFLDGCIIIASYDLELSITTYTTASVLGFEWILEKTKTDIEVLHKDDVDDCILTFYKNKLIQRVDLKKRTYNNWNNNQNNKPKFLQKTIEQDPYQGLTKKQRKLAKRVDEMLAKADREDVGRRGEESLIDEKGDYKLNYMD